MTRETAIMAATGITPAPWWVTGFWMLVFVVIFSPLLASVLRLG